MGMTDKIINMPEVKIINSVEINADKYVPNPTNMILANIIKEAMI